MTSRTPLRREALVGATRRSRPDVLVSHAQDEGDVERLAQDDSSVYYYGYKTNETPVGSVRSLILSRVPRAGGANQVVASLPGGSLVPDTLVAAGEFVYFTGYLSDTAAPTKQVLRIPKAGGVPQSVARVTGPEEGSWLAVDEQQTVYYGANGHLYGVAATNNGVLSQRRI